LDRDGTPMYAEESFSKGRCSIGRFRGQTLIYVPRDIEKKLGRQCIEELAEGVFGKKTLDDFFASYYLFRDCVQLELHRPWNILILRDITDLNSLSD